MKSFLYAFFSFLIDLALAKFQVKYDRACRISKIVEQDLETCNENDRLYVILIRDLEELVTELRELKDEIEDCKKTKEALALKLGI